jgi:hypothetical protein
VPCRVHEASGCCCTWLCGSAGGVKHGVLQSCTPYSLCLQAPEFGQPLAFCICTAGQNL